MSLEDLYREVILDHYRNPRNRDPLPHPDATAEGVNPLCGDEVAIELEFDGDVITSISVRGQGCSISQSSASMMSAAVKSKSRQEVASLVERFRHMMDIDTEDMVDETAPGSVMGDLEALRGVRQYPVRIKCALLAWATLQDALDGSIDA